MYGPEGILLVLDQVTDPQNVGAALRFAAAFGLPASYCQPGTPRPSPAPSPRPRVAPRHRARHYDWELGASPGTAWRGGFPVSDSPRKEASRSETTTLTLPLALVLGAEGKGLRQLTRETCDRLCRISTKRPLASLNVSNAAAIALHWASVTAQGVQGKSDLRVAGLFLPGHHRPGLLTGG
jgi:23S rRNA (guanosine2251-2'-O)-methyltransferase